MSLRTFNKPLIRSLRLRLYSDEVETTTYTRAARFPIAVLMVAIATGAFLPFRAEINSTTVGLGFLLVVLFVAILWGSGPALLASVLAMLSFNFFFLPPFHTLTIADPQNWVALIAFFITAVAVGQLSARARRRAEEAEAGRHEIKRLFEELQDAFEKASETEALKRSETFKSALLDAITHDLRTPLTSIKASATLLLEENETTNLEPSDQTEQQALLKVITQSADRLDRFVEGIVDLAKIEAGGLDLNRNWGGVDEIIEAAVSRAEPLAVHHQLFIEVEDELPAIRVDARAVAEVIYVLIENAAKYSPVGCHIKVEASRFADDTVQISVEDEGPGIPVHLRERVFERFFRVNGDNKIGGLGLGMGLAIAKGIIEAHGGRIWIADRNGSLGTRVSFTVPVGDDESSAGSPRPAVEADG
jgi:K+-sensing histidine kinase KdpD